MCNFGSFSGFYGNGSQRIIKNRGKMVIFVICVILRCDLFPIITPKGISIVIKTFLPRGGGGGDTQVQRGAAP